MKTMKMYALAAVAAALLAGNVQTQAQIKYGVVAGVNLSTVSFSGNAAQNFDSGNRAGWYGGAKVEFTVPVIGIGADVALLYSQRDLKLKDGSAEASTKQLQSIEVPLNVKYTVGFSSLASVYAATGPQFGFNVGGAKWSWDVQKQFELRKANVTWNIGVGATVLKHLQAGILYNIALSKFSKKYEGAGGDMSLKANSWQMQVAYLF